MHNFNDPANVREQFIGYNADNMPEQIDWAAFFGSTLVGYRAEFAYDGHSRRVKKTNSWAPSGFYETFNETFYISEHFEIVNGTEVKYIFAGNQRVAKVTAAETHYFHKDHLGSSNVVTDYANGAAVQTNEYMPFGQTRTQSGDDISSYKFTDQELDPSTGLYNYDARLYDPVIGRFVSADTIVEDFFIPQTLNRYSYVRNNPLRYTDPTGHWIDPGVDHYKNEDHTGDVVIKNPSNENSYGLYNGSRRGTKYNREFSADSKPMYRQKYLAQKKASVANLLHRHQMIKNKGDAHTTQIGIGLNSGAGIGTTKSAGIVWSWDPEKVQHEFGVFSSGGAGLHAGATGDLVIDYTTSENNEISDLDGFASTTGGGVTTPMLGPHAGIGYETSTPLTSNAKPSKTISPGIGIGTPGEAHTSVTYTKTKVLFTWQAR
jgi:RHS repeat-associated protein